MNPGSLEAWTKSVKESHRERPMSSRRILRKDRRPSMSRILWLVETATTSLCCWVGTPTLLHHQVWKFQLSNKIPQTYVPHWNQLPCTLSKLCWVSAIVDNWIIFSCEYLIFSVATRADCGLRSSGEVRSRKSDSWTLTIVTHNSEMCQRSIHCPSLLFPFYLSHIVCCSLKIWT